MKISKEDEKLLKEIQADEKAYQLLRDKCEWEQMSLYAVLREWGDPREWDSYKELR